MLKIKDNVDLKVLVENFGFRESYLFYFKNLVIIDKNKKEIFGPIKDVLFDLIQAGLVEKL